MEETLKKQITTARQIYTAALACAFALGFAAQASAGTTFAIDFTATDGSTVTAAGSIDVSGGYATSGTIDFEGSGWLSFPGTYTLDTDYSETAAQGGFSCSDPNCYTSPNGYFYFDNAFSGTSPYLDDAGLLFTMEVPEEQIFDDGSLTTGTLTAEVSLWWDGSEYVAADDFNGPYASQNGSAAPYDADQGPDPTDFPYEFTGTLDASTVPEPSTYIAGPFLLLLIGASALPMLRKKQAL